MTREILDRYYTPRWAIDALLDTYPAIRGGIALEPFKGQRGHISDALTTVFEVVYSGDKDPEVKCDFFWDVLTDSVPDEYSQPEWIVTNPPYLTKKMGEIVSKLLSITPNVALLVPISFLEPAKDRKKFLITNPPNYSLILPRIKFDRIDANGKIITEKGSAFATYTWLIWSTELKTSHPPIKIWEGNRPIKK